LRQQPAGGPLLLVAGKRGRGGRIPQPLLSRLGPGISGLSGKTRVNERRPTLRFGAPQPGGRTLVEPHGERFPVVVLGEIRREPSGAPRAKSSSGAAVGQRRRGLGTRPPGENVGQCIPPRGGTAAGASPSGPMGDYATRARPELRSPRPPAPPQASPDRRSYRATPNPDARDWRREDPPPWH